jgi:DNA replication factor GINS
MKEGDISSMPRWMAQTFSESGIVTIHNKDNCFTSQEHLTWKEIARARSFRHKCRLLHSCQRLSFFFRRKDRERIIISLNSFVVSRIEKIVKLAATSTLTAAIREKLSVEERELYDLIHESTFAFKRRVLRKFD